MRCGTITPTGATAIASRCVGRSRADFDDCANAVRDRVKRRIATDGHVPAADVEANAGNADLLLVGNDATDRLCVTEVAIGAHDARVIERLEQRRQAEAPTVTSPPIAPASQ